MSEKIRVLIVDDSPLVREAIRSILSSDPGIEVVGLARDGREGVEKTLSLRPDVITMDLKMPLMNGSEAIQEIMENLPTPIIAVSSLDVKTIVSALSIGAMDFVAITDNIEEMSKDLIDKVRIASRVKPMRHIRIKKIPVIGIKKVPKREASKVVVIGVSTGGPQALQVLLSHLPHDLGAGVLVVQHIARGFVRGLAEWLAGNSHLDIRVAQAGDILKNSSAFFAPDERNMTIDEDGRILLSEDIAKRYIYVPSIDATMKSAAEAFGERSMGVIMTGMARDGVDGICAIKKAGGITLAQDRDSSAIFGMNKIAIDSGCVDKVVALDSMADAIVDMVKVMGE